MNIFSHVGILSILQPLRRLNNWQAVSGFIEAGLLKVATLTGEQIERMHDELDSLPVGLEDQTALFLAMELGAILLTGDRRLRLEGLKRKIEVRGVLWILDELVTKQLLPSRLAAVKLRSMITDGAFLPRDECEKRFQAWESSE